MTTNNQKELHAVTGAFGYSGQYIAHRLLSEGKSVCTLTNSPGRDSQLARSLDVRPLAFDQPDALSQALRNVNVLYNTYWVRFDHKNFSHAQAVDNTLRLFDAAKRAGVERVVHVSITNPSLSSRLGYFRGKAELEQALISSGMSHAILRPAVLFGGVDILINNIAWMLRTFPVFGTFGDGQYKLQPIHVEDFAELAVMEGGSAENHIVNAIGPETFSYRELVQVISQAIGKRRPIIQLPPSLGLLMSRIMGWFVRDVVITRDEIKGLMDNLLHVEDKPAGGTRLTDWANANFAMLGKRYANELRRRKDRQKAYAAR